MARPGIVKNRLPFVSGQRMCHRLHLDGLALHTERPHHGPIVPVGNARMLIAINFSPARGGV